MGQTVDVEVSSNTEEVYYVITPSSRRTITVSVTEGDNATIEVLNSNERQVRATAGAQNSSSMSFTASANNTYYIVIVGEKNAEFTIS